MQVRAGVERQAGRVGKIIGSTLPPAAQEFLRRQPFAVVSSMSREGRVWVSVLAGQPEFMYAVDEQTVAINSMLADYDPLRENLSVNPHIGMLVIEFDTRRRMRINGKASLRDNGLVIHAQQVYSNCPKYIQARAWEFAQTIATPVTAQRSDTLNAGQRKWIQQADTFFIGSFHPESGADASHRGGNPSFVKVLDEKTLLWPDYIGNNMFNTLGNIAAYPQAGLLFLDFEQGAILQMAGVAQILWDKSLHKQLAGAQRAVRFALTDVIEASGGIPLQWKLVEYSPFNPVLS